MTVHVGEPELHRLYLKVQAVGGVAGVRVELRALEDTERDQRCQALAVWRYLVNAKASIGVRRGFHPIFSASAPR